MFDFVSDEQKEKFDIKYPDLPEYSKEEKLAYEKEVLGVYISGHPLEDYEEKLRKNVKSYSKDFVEEEDGTMIVSDNQYTSIGGMVEDIVIKNTRTGKTMAFLTIEDLYGTVEVLVFPNVLDKFRYMIKMDAKLLITGRVTVNDEIKGKLICDKIVELDKIPAQLWIQFQNKEEYLKYEEYLKEMIQSEDGNDTLVVYLKEEKQKKVYPKNMSICITRELKDTMIDRFGEDNVRVVEKSIEIS